MTFSDFFSSGNGPDRLDPYHWQRSLADQPEPQSLLIDIPTGLGKTAGVIFAWAWNRLSKDTEQSAREKWPLRLVYCLPMRTLVEQTQHEAERWMENLESAGLIEQAPRIVVLMGGEGPDREWDLYPEDPAILIGTQDMLLSRALNRGYGMSRFRWPLPFALLNNDALWVMDEVQLMGVGVETSSQLHALREKLGLSRSAWSWWMSATLDRNRLQTFDNPASFDPEQVLELEAEDLSTATVKNRVEAGKRIEKAQPILDSPTQAEVGKYCKQLASLAKTEHHSGSLSLVIVNTVERAKAVYKELNSLMPELSKNQRLLLHSRFRPFERKSINKDLANIRNGVVVATQAAEAGLDIDARLMITEAAPWSSMVQRFGRCNRRGEQPAACIRWVPIATKDSKQAAKLCAPYTPEAIAAAQAALEPLSNASPAELRKVSVAEQPVVRPMIRRKDVLDLFDTTPDLSGQDIDVSRFVRDQDEEESADVFVFWRAFNGRPSEEEPAAQPDELCRISRGAFIAFAEALAKKQKKDKKTARGPFRWDHLEGNWQEERIGKNNPPAAGQIFMLHVEAGGYCTKLGWTGNEKDKPKPLVLEKPLPAEGNDSDRLSQAAQDLSLAMHTEDVVAEVSAIAEALQIPTEDKALLRTAAGWHDVGKAHPAFQKMLYRLGEKDALPDPVEILAKSSTPGRRVSVRPHFRHELASALAWLQAGEHATEDERDLIAYLIAAHHGKVRLSIRSMPNERGDPAEPNKLFARGVWDKDTLLPFSLNGGDTRHGTVVLNLGIMQLGGEGEDESWTERMLRLRDTLGPFRLAWLETLLRTADMRASQKESEMKG